MEQCVKCENRFQYRVLRNKTKQKVEARTKTTKSKTAERNSQSKGDKTQTVKQKTRQKKTTSLQRHHIKGSSLETANHRTAYSTLT